MESQYLPSSQQIVCHDEKPGFVQSKCAHKTIKKASLDSHVLWHTEHGNHVGETLWVEPNTPQGPVKAGGGGVKTHFQPGGSQSSLPMRVIWGP